MPRRGNELQSILTNLKQQSGKALASLRREIGRREQELALLKATETQWQQVLGLKAKTPAVGSLRTRRLGQKRLNWESILAALPMTFDNKQVLQATGKPIEQVYAGLSRWVKDKKIRKGPDGMYQKLSAAATQKKTAA
jgi:hypothetical protein